MSKLFLFPLLTAIAILPGASFAQSTLKSAPTPVAPNNAIERPMGVPEKIKLTSDQQKKLKMSVVSMRQKIEGVLTPDQRKKFTESARTKAQIAPTLKTLNLTPDQTAKVRAIATDFNKEMTALLTPDQLKQLQQIQAERKNK
jgi:Spy/CpxP family protein refolding chaperone